MGPSGGLKSEVLELSDSRFGAGRGSLSGTVGRGADEKYLYRRK